MKKTNETKATANTIQARNTTSAQALVKAILATEKGAKRVIDKKLFSNFIKGLKELHLEFYQYKLILETLETKGKKEKALAQLDKLHTLGKQTFLLLGDFNGVNIKLSTTFENDSETTSIFNDFYAFSFICESYNKSAKVSELVLKKATLNKQKNNALNVEEDIKKYKALCNEIKAVNEDLKVLKAEDNATASRFTLSNFDSYFLPLALISLRNCIKKAQTRTLEDIKKEKEKRAKERAKKRNEKKQAKAKEQTNNNTSK